MLLLVIYLIRYFMNMQPSEDWEKEIGKQIRTLRIREDLNQQQLADRAGIALKAVKHLENGKRATLRSLIKALRVLGRETWLKTLSPAVSISPMQVLPGGAMRQRATRKR